MGNRRLALGLFALAACGVPDARLEGTDAALVDAPPDAPPANLNVSPSTAVDFGDVVINTTSNDYTINVSNNGGTTSGQLRVFFDDTTLGYDFSSDTCSGQALAPHGMCNFSFHITPNASGAAQTMLHVADGSDDVAIMVKANGLTKGQINIVEDSFQFGPLGIDAAKVTHVFTVENDGQQAIAIMGVSLSSEPSFQIDQSTCNGMLGYLQQCVVTVSFHPTSVGSKTGSVRVDATPTGDSDSAGLTGDGTAHVTIVPGGNGTGHVDTNPLAGLDCGSICESDYDMSPIILDEQPGAGSTFSAWGSDCVGTGTTCSLTLDASKQVSATFTLAKEALTISPAGNGAANGTITSSDSNINCPGTCSYSYDYNNTSSIVLTASAPAGTTFTGWSGDCSGTGTCSVTMNQPHNVTATFTLDKEQLQVINAGTGTGTITDNTSTINCGTTCNGSYDWGTQITLTAAPSTGSNFSSWTNCPSASGNQCTVMMKQAAQITATFTQGTYKVTAAVSGSGSVASQDGNISCGSACSYSYTYNAAVKLIATPATGYHFNHWTGGPCDASTSATCSFNMPATAVTTTAVFTIDSETLTVNVNAASTGTGSVSGGGITSCTTGSCTSAVNYNTQVVLTATPNSGATATWTGCDSSTSTTCTLILTTSRTVGVTFNAGPQKLSATIAGNGAGSVSDGASFSCSAGTCTSSYTFNTPVTLTATPQGAASFAGWSGDCTGTGTCTVTMNQARNVTATFSAGDQTLTLMNNGGSGSGSFTIAETPVTVSGTTYTFHYDTTVHITANPDATSTFNGWTGDCAGQGATCTLTMDRPRSATAIFQLVNYKLQLSYASSNGGTGTAAPQVLGTPCPAPAVRCWLYPAGTTVNIDATAASGSTFVGWSLSSCTGTGTCTFTLNAATTVTANFVTNYTLTVTNSGGSDGNGSGTVTGGGINCTTGVSSGCSLDFPGITPATVVTLSASAAGGSAFSGWGGACSTAGTSPTCSVTMNQARSVTATFTKQYTLAATAGTGGTVSLAPAGSPMGCGTSCAYSAGQTVTVSASPSSSSYYFVSWTGACAGQGANCSLTMTMDETTAATFAPYAPLGVTVAGTGTVTSSDGNISCGNGSTACSFSYPTTPSAKMVTLTATAGAGTTFFGWSGAGCSGTGQCMVTMDMARSVTATFYNNLQTGTSGISGKVTAPTNGAITCTVDVADGYSSCLAYAPGTSVSLTAAPDVGSSFVSWTGDCSGQGAACALTMSAPHATIAVFKQITHNLQLTISGPTGNTVTPDHTGTSCGTLCWTYNYNDTVKLTPSAASGSTFLGWSSSGCPGTGPCTVTMTSDINETATFSSVVALTVATSGDGSGTVQSDLAGLDGMKINCTTGSATGCTETYASASAQMVTLSPSVSGATSVFSGWSGACTNATGNCVVTMSQARSVTATFKAIYTLTASAGTGGSIAFQTPSYTGTACTGTTCQYLSGTTVTLQETPSTGYNLSSWTGCDSTSGNTCSVAMGMSRTVSASFAKQQVTLTITAPTGGTITSTDSHINCGGTNTACSYTYNYGDSVSLSANATSPWVFASWTGCSSSTSSCTITSLTANTTVATTFNPSLTVTVSGSGSVSSTPGGINSCTGTCSANFTFNGSVQLNATAGTGYHFSGWSGGGCSGTGSCTVAMSQTQSVTATFAKDQHTVTITAPTGGSVSGSGFSCPGTCQLTFNYGDTVSLSETPSSGYQFAGWGGSCSGTGSTCAFTVGTSNATVSASYNPISYSLALTVGAGGSVTVNGTTYTANTTLSFPYNTAMTVIANASSGWTFTGWSGYCSGSSTTCTFSMPATNISIGSSFAQTTTLTVSLSSLQVSWVNIVGPGINCGDSGAGACSTTLQVGGVYQLYQSDLGLGCSIPNGGGPGNRTVTGCSCGGSCSWDAANSVCNVALNAPTTVSFATQCQ